MHGRRSKLFFGPQHYVLRVRRESPTPVQTVPSGKKTDEQSCSDDVLSLHQPSSHMPEPLPQRMRNEREADVLVRDDTTVLDREEGDG